MLKDDHISINFKKIKYELRHMNDKMEVIKVEEKIDDAEYLKKYKMTKHKSGFLLYDTREEDEPIIGEQESMHLFLKNEKKNFYLTIWNHGMSEHTGEWLDFWGEDLKVLYEILSSSEDVLDSILDNWLIDLCIYKEIRGQEDMSHFDSTALCYENYYCLDFGCGFDKLFRNKEFREGLERIGIYNISIYESSDLLMFIKDLTNETFLQSLKRYSQMSKFLKEIRKRTDEVDKNFFEEIQPLGMIKEI